MNEVDYDVAIIGAGPTGLTLAQFLGSAGVSVVLLERNPSTVQEPRAVSIDDEALRTMQGIGLAEPILRDVALDYGSSYFSSRGVCFAKVEPQSREYGFPKRNAFTQPKLEATLRDGLDRFPRVRVCFRQACATVTEEADGVVLGITSPTGTRTLRARYAVGCDGARSTVRKAMGSRLAGSTYDQRWLIVDLASTREAWRQTRVICDPARPAICLPGPHGIRRYEFRLNETETDELATTPAFVRSLLAANGPDAESPVVRSRVYAFHARIADRWQTRRIFIAGDAAHLSPPFAGQGMNSGLRDAHNLGWKLAAVLRGEFGPELLATYEIERRPHATALIRLAVAMGRVMMPTSRLQAGLIQTAFRWARLVPAVQGYFAEMKYKPKPYYRQGFVVPGATTGVVGRMLPQPRLEGDRFRGMLDDALGSGFALVAYGVEAERTQLWAAGIPFGPFELARAAIVPAHYNPQDTATEGVVTGRDVEARLAPFLPGAAEWLLLVRPDRYIAAAGKITAREEVVQFAAGVRSWITEFFPPAAAPSPSLVASAMQAKPAWLPLLRANARPMT